ncbi:hypothetical protein [Vibrio phage BONAISHI]|nr:hypothetical protein [Vibrio phage BONAISHI]
MTLPMRDEEYKEYIVVNAVDQQPKAEKHLPEASIDKKILERIEKLPEALLEALDDWILVPDAKLIPKLMELSKAIAPLYGKQSLKLLRGFGGAPEYQDTMGLEFESGFWRRGLKAKIGDEFKYANERPLSMTTDLDIAAAFGDNVVRTTQEIKMFDNNLPITSELSYIVSKRRNLGETKTQKEVVLFPGEYTFYIVQKKR